MIVDVDFVEVDAPSGKQVDFVNDICRVVGVRKPKEYTREAYSEFIERYKYDYYEGNREEEY